MSGSDAKSLSWPAVGFLLLVNLIALSFFYSPGTGDVAIWETWMREISSYGVIGGFAHTGTDYPPRSLFWVPLFDAPRRLALRNSLS
jgi:hypothetical protein